MRITNGIIQRNALSQLQSGLRRIADAQQKVGTGMRIQRASDDPVAASSAMGARSSLRALEQYQRNVDQASLRAATEENVLDQLSDILTRAKELGIGNLGGVSEESRKFAKAELDELIEQALQLANTKHGDEFLFGGKWVDSPPFDPAQTAQTPRFASIDPNTGLPRVPAGVPATEIGSGRYIKATHDGEEVFLDSGVLDALKSITDAMADPTDPQAAISAAIGEIDDAFGNVQELLGDIGGRTNQLELTKANLDSLKINLESVRANLEEVEFEEAVTELVSRQTAFQAAMLATSKVMGLTLADYLR